MENEKQLDTIEEELKLLKGELKQSLASVRDYLLNMELPTTEFSTILAALGDSGDTTMNMKGTFQLPPDNQAQDENENKPESETEEKEAEDQEPNKKDGSGHSQAKEDDESTMLQDEDIETPEEEDAVPEETEDAETDIEEEQKLEEDIFDEEEPIMSDAEMPLEEQLMDYAMPGGQLGQSVPKVNLLANLISWISVARREIGDDQLPTFLEVYGISGYLSPEMKDVILHLANITSEKPGENNMAEIWSNSMLSLHGILTGGETPLNPMKPDWAGLDEEVVPLEEENPEAEEPEERPVKLKLVFPNGDGQGKEYCIDLTPEQKSEEPEE